MKNYYKFEVRGLNQEKLFNDLSKEFDIFEIDRKEKDHSFFKVRFSEGKKAEKFILNKGFEILSVQKGGIQYRLFKAICSYGLILGLALGIIGFFIQAAFIRKIEVWGNEKIEDAAIISVVNENLGSRFKSKVDTKVLENKVYSSFEDLSFVSIAIVGQTVVVNVKEEIIPDEMRGDFQPIYAAADGLITEIELIQGTLCVAVGDIIQEGQVLVLPYVISSSGEEMPVKARANIYADVWITGEETHSSSYQETYRTGEKVTRNEIFLGSLKIYEKPCENPFQTFEVEEGRENLSSNNVLPLVLKTTTYYETATRLVEQPFDEVKGEIIEKAKAKALQKILECDIIKKENTVTRKLGNITTISHTITVSRNIGEENESIHGQS